MFGLIVSLAYLRVNHAHGCSSSSFTVSASGTFTTSVAARSSIGIHTGQMITGSPSSTKTTTPTSTPTATSVYVTFAPTVTTVYGENVFLVGNTSALGSWSPSSAVCAACSVELSVAQLFLRLHCPQHRIRCGKFLSAFRLAAPSYTSTL
jgi:hypothetical protein